MNRGVLQSPVPPVQQMMVTGNPNYGWWSNTYNMQVMTRVPQLLPSSSSFQLPHFLPPHPPSSASSSSSSSSSTWHGEYNFQQDLLPPESWSQLLMEGIMGRDVEDRCGSDHDDQLGKKVKNWDQEHHHVLVLLNQAAAAEDHISNSDVLMKEFLTIKQEKVANDNSDHVYNNNNSHGAGGGVQVHHQDIDHQLMIHQQPSGAPAAAAANNNWSQMSTNNMLNFSTNKPYLIPRHPPPLHPDHSSQCNSSSTTGSTGEPAVKKSRVQASASHSTQATFKVRKEKLGDRITALHQLVSPFGKTDTASVLLEAIGYIRFLHSQVEALSLPYLGGGAGNISHQQPVQMERNCLFPDDPGQLLNGHCIKRKGAPDHQDYHYEEQKKDLRSRGLCLVPISCTMQVESSNGADYWTPAAAFGGGFR